MVLYLFLNSSESSLIFFSLFLGRVERASLSITRLEKLIKKQEQLTKEIEQKIIIAYILTIIMIILVLIIVGVLIW